MAPSSRTGPSVLSVPSNVLRSPMSVSMSIPSTPLLRDMRVVGKPTLTSLVEARKLGPGDAGGGVFWPTRGGPDVVPVVISPVSGVGTAAVSSRSLLDSAPRNRVHSCSSDFLNIGFLLQRLGGIVADGACDVRSIGDR